MVGMWQKINSFTMKYNLCIQIELGEKKLNNRKIVKIG